MKKREQKFQKIQEYKERFRTLSTEQIQKRLSLGIYIKEAAIAYREVLRERGVDSDEE